ncbi:hypothetical protein LJR230_002203 [Trinickia sp. LjRoot230]|uniref:hypothetical protein n=1 Tax=Trinickia sp. LjRoot230 TaxID=3342288 RepID=UPI003ECCB07A
MIQFEDLIVTQLRSLLTEIGDGGRVSASVYDTAQLLRHSAAGSNRDDAYLWLIEQQQPDGGWGHPDHPLFRTMSTAAAILALHGIPLRSASRDAAIAAGLEFFACEPARYRDSVPDEAPIGIELILPRLCRDAAAAGLTLAPDAFHALERLAESRLAALTSMTPLPVGHPALHSWESWGAAPDTVELDRYGSVGISPSATAAWLHHARRIGVGEERQKAALAYLENAARATGTGVAGVVPNVWPIDVFEPCWVLHCLAAAGLIDHPALSDLVLPIANTLAAQMTEHGLGPAVGFAADADDTGVALAVLAMTGHRFDFDPLERFQRGNLFVTFPGERNPALSTTIHAFHAMRLLEKAAPQARAYIDSSRDVSGVWRHEKWHASWLYPTSHALLALAEGDARWHDERALATLLDAQHACGGWGCGSTASREETAYALFGLRLLADGATKTAAQSITHAVSAALRWLLDQQTTARESDRALWIGKELYCPSRVVRAAELAAILLAIRWPAGRGASREG